MRTAIDLIVRRLRLRNPWNYKAPLLIAFPYFAIGAGRVSWDRAVAGILAALCTIAGTAGVAYFLNDLADARQDRLAGKDNAVADLPWPQRLLLFVLFLTAALAPWLYLPFTRATGALLVAELGLFIVYCFPPFRLKERAFWGIAADATYAHALPAVLAMLTFALMASEPYRDLRIVAVTLGAWQFAVGMRNIALHQLHDRERDARAGARTLAITFGAAKLERLLRVVFVPLEIATFAVFLVVLTRSIPWLPLACAIYVVAATIRLKVLQQPFPATIRDALYVFADNFYADWLPLVVLGFMIASVPSTWPIGVLHLLVFRNGVRQSIRDARGYLVAPMAAERAS